MSAKQKKGLDTLPNEIRLDLRQTIALKVCSREAMKEKDQKRLMHDLFYGSERDEDSISYLDMCLKGDGDFEGLFEVTGNEGQKKLKKNIL